MATIPAPLGSPETPNIQQTNTAFSIGNGIVEIAALTALVGSTTAESLILGDRGAAGMAWAAMSSFGSLFLMKASLAAATPESLRETIGVGNERSNAAVGLNVPFSRAMKVTGQTVGIVVQVQRVAQGENDSPSDCQNQITFRGQEEVRYFDSYSRALLSRCALVDKDRPVQPYIYSRDALYWSQKHKRRGRKDWIGLACSLVKLVEFFLLYRQGSRRLAWITTLNWAFFFSGAAVLQLLDISREIEDTGTSSLRMDILEGNIPMTQAPGDKRRVLFDVPLSVRRHTAWRIIWFLGAVVCGYSLVALYTTLTALSRGSFMIWAGFQCLWLVVRLLYFQVADEIIQISHSLAPLSHEELDQPQIRTRLLGLTAALGQHQTRLHPRGAYCYGKDVNTTLAIAQALQSVGSHVTSEIGDYTDFAVNDITHVDIQAAFSDALLASVAWINGLPYDGMDIYDSSLLLIKPLSSDHPILVPVCRVLSGPPTPSTATASSATDPSEQEKNIAPSPNFVPKGGINDGTNLSWVFWIPAGKNRWLYLKSGLDFLGTKRVEVLNDSEVTRRLQIGDLYIGLRDVAEVKGIVRKSCVVGEVLCDMVMDSGSLKGGAMER